MGDDNNIENNFKTNIKLNGVVEGLSNFAEHLRKLPIVVDTIKEGLIKISKVMESLSKELSHKKGTNIFIVSSFLESNENFLNPFMEGGLCPPIFYIIKDFTLEDLIEYDEKYSNINITTLLKDSGLKEYYVESMDEWIEDESEEYVRQLIQEIKKNFKSNNIYVTSLSLLTLIEYKVRKAAEMTGKPIGKDNITVKIVSTLKSNCFKNGTMPQLNRLFNLFFDRSSEYYLYKDTQSNPISITRHILHGERLDLVNEQNMMNLVFITDILYKMLIDYEI